MHCLLGMRDSWQGKATARHGQLICFLTVSDWFQFDLENRQIEFELLHLIFPICIQADTFVGSTTRFSSVTTRTASSPLAHRWV